MTLELKVIEFSTHSVTIDNGDKYFSYEMDFNGVWFRDNGNEPAIEFIQDICNRLHGEKMELAAVLKMAAKGMYAANNTNRFSGQKDGVYGQFWRAAHQALTIDHDEAAANEALDQWATNGEWPAKFVGASY